MAQVQDVSCRLSGLKLREEVGIFTPDRRQSKTLLTIDESGSKKNLKQCF